jgi:EAL domain-containing protein (putative c-di-GMP-specific phosphodiesterase class I)
MRKRVRTRPADLSALRLLLRPGFLLSFSVALLLAVGLLTFAVSRILGSVIRTEQLSSATRSAELLAGSSFAPLLNGSAGRLGNGLLASLDQAALAARRTAGLEGVEVFDRRSRVLYATDHRMIGGSVLRFPEARRALSGEATTDVRNSASSPLATVAGEQIDVGVPIYAANTARPTAAAEVILPYGPVAEEVSSQTQRIDFILIAAGLLFYAALWPTLLRAARAMRRQADPRTKALLRELAEGIKRDELLLHYQPTIDLDQSRVVAVEALLRWQHPKRGLLAPSEFLPTIASGALSGELALHVVGMALRDCREWRDRGIDAAVNINLSVANVLDQALPEEIGKLLASGGIPPAALGLEVTEAAIVSDPEKASVMLRALDRMGVRITIDNFGTGYSSLACLRDLPVSELKVDREFVGGIRLRRRDKAIVRLIIRLAHELEIKVIAEGVEDVETLNELAALTCDMAQGYYFSRPLPLAELVAWFETPVIAGYVAATEPPLASLSAG